MWGRRGLVFGEVLVGTLAGTLACVNVETVPALAGTSGVVLHSRTVLFFLQRLSNCLPGCDSFGDLIHSSSGDAILVLRFLYAGDPLVRVCWPERRCGRVYRWSYWSGRSAASYLATRDGPQVVRSLVGLRVR